MYTIHTDRSHRRIYLTLSGFLSLAETKIAADQVIAAAKTLGPGFDIINDVSSFKPATPEAAQEIQRAQAFIQQAGVRRIVRIVGQNALSAMQFARTSKTAGYTAEAAATVADAEKLLNS
jgi:hypothetical protein